MIYLIIILTFSLFILLPVKFHAAILKKGSDEYIQVETRCFKILNISLEIPKMQFTIKNFIPTLNFEYHIDNKNNKVPESEKVVMSFLSDRYKIIVNMIKTLFKHISNLKKVIRFLSKHIKVLEFSIGITFGGENAALTGILAGQAWSAVYCGLGIASFYLNFDNANIKTNVTPVFTKYEPLQIDIDCIFQLRVGHIIIASSIAIWYWLLFTLSSAKKNHINQKLYDKKERRGYG